MKKLLLALTAGLAIACTPISRREVSESLGSKSGVNSLTIPIEVYGANGTVRSSQVFVNSTAGFEDPFLYLKVHGIQYENQMKVRVNSSTWISVVESNVQYLNKELSVGGIGGGAHTLSLRLKLPRGILVAGLNTVDFQFDHTDGVVNGFRVLKFNFQNSFGQSLLSESIFSEEDPSRWRPPYSGAPDILEGENLYKNAQLINPGNGLAMIAHCADCHTKDGRDLKYFNYSNFTIQQRAIFHGLTQKQGDQIASYIRSLNSPAHGRPWNPPYQPGPGMDSRPVEQWSAGAGIDLVLSQDSQSFGYLFSGNTVNPQTLSATSSINAREIPISLQLPDWNHWLPRVHPLDAYGASFSNVKNSYENLRNALQVGDTVSYQNSLGQSFASFLSARDAFQASLLPSDPVPNGFYNRQVAHSIYSFSLWSAVKNWEIAQEFGLEAMAQIPFPNFTPPRAWNTNIAFTTAPELSTGGSSYPWLFNGRQNTFDASSFAWYYLQIILNDSNRTQLVKTPIDWGLTVSVLGRLASSNSGRAALMTIVQTKALQSKTNGIGPEDSARGFNWVATDPARLITGTSFNAWSEIPAEFQAQLFEGMLKAWLNQASSFTPARYYQGLQTSANEVPAANNMNYQPDMATQVNFMIPRFKASGVSQNQINLLAAWAKLMWPSSTSRWDEAAQSVTCNGSPGGVMVCSNNF